jgi:hypothetical protein
MDVFALIVACLVWWRYSRRTGRLEAALSDLRLQLARKDDLLQELTRRVYRLESGVGQGLAPGVEEQTHAAADLLQPSEELAERSFEGELTAPPAYLAPTGLDDRGYPIGSEPIGSEPIGSEIEERAGQARDIDQTAAPEPFAQPQAESEMLSPASARSTASEPPTQEPPPQPLPAPRPPAPPRDWEALIGTSLLNAVGVLILVIGISLLLGYTLTVLGPLGKVAIGVLIGVLMIGGGIAVERRERFAIFGRGLIAGGWAALYFTAYAMHALPAARVIDSPVLGAGLLLAVAAGMIAHSLRYRSQGLTLLAFLTAFLALVLAPATLLSVAAAVPLTLALLTISRRLDWAEIPVAGMLLTYFSFAFRYDAANFGVMAGAGTLYTYWICYEIHDLLRVRSGAVRGYLEGAIFPLNILLLFGVASMTLPSSTPIAASNFLASLGVLMTVSTALRMRWRTEPDPESKDPVQRAMALSYRLGVAIAAALFAGALLNRFDGYRAEIGLLLEAQLLIFAGLRLGDRFFWRTGHAVFALAAAHVLFVNNHAGQRAWGIMLAVMAAQAYTNRWLTKIDPFLTYAATTLLAIGAGDLAPDRWFGVAWLVLSAALVEVWLRLQPGPLAAQQAAQAPESSNQSSDQSSAGEQGSEANLRGAPSRRGRSSPWSEFRHQALGLGLLAVIGNLLLGFDAGASHRNTITAVETAGALIAYAISIRLQGRDEFLRTGASWGGTLMAAWAIWLALPAPLVALGWGLLSLLLLDRGVLTGSRSLRTQAHLLFCGAFVRVFFANLPVVSHTGFVSHRLLTVAPLILLAIWAWRRTPETRVAALYSWTATILTVALLRFELGRTVSMLGWAVLMLVLWWLHTRRGFGELRWQAWLVALLTFARAWATNFYSPDLSLTARLLLGLCVIGAFHGAQFLTQRDDRSRGAFSLAGSALLGLMLFHESSGRLLTISWGVQAVLTLAAGFASQERILRLTGLSLFLICILKLFLYDLRELDTLGRILSFIVLGIVLMGASWLYMRFKNQIQRYL